MSGPDPSSARPGDWVMVHDVVLPAGSRAPGVPPETQAVPLEMRLKGFLVGGPATVGDRVTVRTLTGRLVTGRLVAVNPAVPPTFGRPVPELLAVGPELRARLRAGGPRRPGPGAGLSPGAAPSPGATSSPPEATPPPGEETR